jgi:cell wall-associated NlpC family hydrolase
MSSRTLLSRALLSSRPVAVLAAALLTISLLAVPASASQFSDTRGSVHEPAIEALAREGIVNGCDDGRFCPEATLNRGQVATLLANALNLDTSKRGDSRFRDTAGSVHEGAIEAIAREGYTAGCTSTAFCPNDPVTRGQLATLLDKAFDLSPARDRRYFDDTAGIVHEGAIERLADEGIAAGCTHIHFCPTQRLTRGQGATFLGRALDHVDRVWVEDYEVRKREYDRQRERERQAAAASAETPAQRAVDTALQQVGKPYQWGGSGPNSFDCSGLTGYAWRAGGVQLPRTSRDQYAATQRINRSQLQPGDLIFYHQPISHVAMYIGDGKVVEAPNSNNRVRVSETGLSRSGIVGYGRPR